MKRRRRLATLGASLALHGGVLLAVLLAISGETEVGALFIDLTEGAASGTRGGGARSVQERAAGEATYAARPAAPPPPAPVSAPTLAATRAPASSLAASAPVPPEPVASPPSREASEREAAPAELPAQRVEPADATAFASAERSGASPAAPTPGGAPAGSAATGGGLGGLGARGGVPGGAPDVSHGLALARPGSGGSGAGAEYGTYLGRLRRRIEQSLRYPLAARRRGLSGTVHVEIVIRPDGVIGAVAVVDSSSHPVLDEAAVETIKRLPPEPFPADVPPRSLRVRLPVVFALE